MLRINSFPDKDEYNELGATWGPKEQVWAIALGTDLRRACDKGLLMDIEDIYAECMRGEFLRNHRPAVEREVLLQMWRIAQHIKRRRNVSTKECWQM